MLFGSVAEGKSSARSDIDLMVMLLKGEHYWDFKHALEEALGYPVDLHTQDDDPVFVEKILSHGEVVYEAQA